MFEFHQIRNTIEKNSHQNLHIFLHHSLSNFDFTYLQVLHKVILLSIKDIKLDYSIYLQGVFRVNRAHSLGTC